MAQPPTKVQAQATRATEVDVAPAGPQAPPGSRIQAYGMTDRGLKRPNNEDNFLIAMLTKALEIHQTSMPQKETQYGKEHGYLFVVADGMGGALGGERASAMAVDCVEHFMLNTFKWFFHLKGSEGQGVLAEFQTALQKVDAKVFHEARHNAELWGMGTTLTMAYCLDHELFVIHVGDSRCYLYRQNDLHQVTKDHTLVQEMLRRGVLQPEEAGTHRLRHVITNVVGGNEAGVHPEVHKIHLEPDDVLLLCSDGLTEMVPDEDIRKVLAAEADPRRACVQLVERANANGGKDNITVIVVRYGT